MIIIIIIYVTFNSNFIIQMFPRPKSVIKFN